MKPAVASPAPLTPVEGSSPPLVLPTPVEAKACRPLLQKLAVCPSHARRERRRQPAAPPAEVR